MLQKVHTRRIHVVLAHKTQRHMYALLCLGLFLHQIVQNIAFNAVEFDHVFEANRVQVGAAFFSDRLDKHLEKCMSVIVGHDLSPVYDHVLAFDEKSVNNVDGIRALIIATVFDHFFGENERFSGQFDVYRLESLPFVGRIVLRAKTVRGRLELEFVDM